ncbi:response regulator transcription factor [Pseudalkalibacillus decolorationis]|uniref:response regulator transcription factor n=1 Tax=Pseudalkalibacillus decolorationis TaxID=163879 RepID=UPI00214998AB|nr:response regulator transcription factor [Pseudalkalibacillus decolorationis]
MDNQKILIVEDEEKIARVIKLELEFEGYEVDTAETGLIGLEKFRNEKWDLVLLDVMLPELNGLEVLRRIRTNDQNTPIILLTARDSVPDKVAGLDHGANDYITKPFQIEELLARVRASLRLNKGSNQSEEVGQELRIGNLTVNEKTRDVIRGKEKIELTPREFDLLVYLLQNKQQVLNRDQLLSAVWGFDYYGDTNVVDVYIRYLRKKIDNNGDSTLIHTIRGVGYVMKEQ